MLVFSRGPSSAHCLSHHHSRFWVFSCWRHFMAVDPEVIFANPDHAIEFLDWHFNPCIPCTPQSHVKKSDSSSFTGEKRRDFRLILSPLPTRKMYTHTSRRSSPCCHPYPDSPQGFVNPDLAAASSLPQRCSSWSPWLQVPAELMVLTVVLMIDICRGSPAPIGWGPRLPLWNSFAVCFHSIALAYFAPFLTLPFKFLHHEAACRSWHAPYPAVAPICTLQILFLLPRTLSLPTPLPNSCSPLMPPLRRSLLPRTPTTPISANRVSLCVLLYACPSTLLYQHCLHYFTLQLPLVHLILEAACLLSMSFVPYLPLFPMPDSRCSRNVCSANEWFHIHSNKCLTRGAWVA